MFIVFPVVGLVLLAALVGVVAMVINPKTRVAGVVLLAIGGVMVVMVAVVVVAISVPHRRSAEERQMAVEMRMEAERRYSEPQRAMEERRSHLDPKFTPTIERPEPLEKTPDHPTPDEPGDSANETKPDSPTTTSGRVLQGMLTALKRSVTGTKEKEQTTRTGANSETTTAAKEIAEAPVEVTVNNQVEAPSVEVSVEATSVEVSVEATSVEATSVEVPKIGSAGPKHVVGAIGVVGLIGLVLMAALAGIVVMLIRPKTRMAGVTLLAIGGVTVVAVAVAVVYSQMRPTAEDMPMEVQLEGVAHSSMEAEYDQPVAVDPLGKTPDPPTPAGSDSSTAAVPKEETEKSPTPEIPAAAAPPTWVGRPPQLEKDEYTVAVDVGPCASLAKCEA